jgi:aryl-phospho-beta-D-glucosidase BglC (GH1 family)
MYDMCVPGQGLTEQNAAEGIYTILDLHAAPGGQNFDWHSYVV